MPSAPAGLYETFLTPARVRVREDRPLNNLNPLRAGGQANPLIPTLLAGEEFADQHDFFDADGRVTQGGGKQVDP